MVIKKIDEVRLKELLANNTQHSLIAKLLGVTRQRIHQITSGYKYILTPEQLLYTFAKQRARRNNLEFNLNVTDITIPKLCPILGITLKSNLVKGPIDSSPTIDRMNNAHGYIKDNIRVISWRANRLKSDATIQELESILAYMKEI